MRTRIDVSEVVCWRLTRRCNRACRFCLSSSGPKFKDPAVDRAAIAQHLRQLAVRKISYSGGEPLLVQGLPALVKYVDGLGLAQSLTTNGDALAQGVPPWFDLLEHVKLSFYGSRDLHDSLMGLGNYDYLLKTAGRLTEVGISVSANFMLSRPSLPEVPRFLADAVAAGFYHVVLQTYISARRPRVDKEMTLPADLALDEVLAQVDLGCLPQGRVRIHDFRQRDWLVVLTEEGKLTLPSNTNEPDHVLGGVFDAQLLPLRGDVAVDAGDALKNIWDIQATSAAVLKM